MRPFFSIIVVCLNPGERLGQTLESIRIQSCGDYEILIKDGLSTDGSIEAVRKEIQEEVRIRIFRQKDRGIYDAMNQALEQVRGRYVYFLNCGDVFYDSEVLGVIKERIQAAERIPESEKELASPDSRFIFYGDIIERLTGQRVSSNPSMDAFGCYRNVPCHQACFYGSGLVKERRFLLQYRVRADYEHFLWCFFRGRAVTVYIPVAVAVYEGGGFSETAENRKISAAEHKEIAGTYLSPGQIRKYRLILLLSLAPLRTRLSSHPLTAGWYQKGKDLLYRWRSGRKDEKK